MEWQGIEWAIGVFELAMLVVPITGFVAYKRRVAQQVLGKASALWRYAALVVSPVAAYGLFIASLIGIEELTRISLMSEEMGRSSPLLIAFGLLVWLCAVLVFGLTLLFVKTHPAPPASS